MFLSKSLVSIESLHAHDGAESRINRRFAGRQCRTCVGGRHRIAREVDRKSKFQRSDGRVWTKKIKGQKDTEKSATRRNSGNVKGFGNRLSGTISSPMNGISTSACTGMAGFSSPSCK